MSDIVAFISARLDEDEALAELQPPWPWHLNAEGGEVIAEDGIEVATAFALSNNQQRNTAAFIARHDPARVLREVAAKREVIEDWRTYADRNKRDDSDEAAGSAWAALSNVLVTLAGMHREHPDYAGDSVDDWTWPDDDPAWRVE